MQKQDFTYVVLKVDPILSYTNQLMHRYFSKRDPLL